MASVFMNRENWDADTQGMRMPCEGEGIGVGDASTCQGTPKVISKSPEAGRQARAGSPARPSEGTSPVDTLVSDSGLRAVRNCTFLLFKPPNVWYFVMIVSRKLYTLNMLL